MFSQVFVCPGRGGGSLPLDLGGWYLPVGLRGVPLGPGVPLDPGVYVCLWVWGCAHTAPGHTPWHTPLNTIPPPHRQSTSRWYASYWNAFLFENILQFKFFEDLRDLVDWITHSQLFIPFWWYLQCDPINNIRYLLGSLRIWYPSSLSSFPELPKLAFCVSVSVRLFFCPCDISIWLF